MKKLAMSLAALAAACPGVQAGVGEWTSAGIPGAYVHRLEYVSGGVAIAAAINGIYRTTNHGSTWTLVQEAPLPYLTGIAVNPANQDQVLIAAQDLLRSTNGGATFQTVPAGGGARPSGPMAAGFSRDGAFAWVIEDEGHVWRSADGGATWARLNGTLPANNYYWIEPDAADRNTLYAGPGMGILISRDAGDTWNPLASANFMYAVTSSRTVAGTALAINTGPYNITRTVDFGANWSPVSAGQQSIFRLATGPGGTAIAGDYLANIYTSMDEGASFTPRGRLPNAEPIWLAFNPADALHILAATQAGVVGSSDGGATWQERIQGLREPRVFNVAVARDGSNAVYAAAIDLASIYRRDAATGAFTGVGRSSTPVLGYPGYQQFGIPDYRIAVSPQDSRTVYMIRDGYFGRSINGGETWTRLSVPGRLTTLTPDPVNPLVIYAGGLVANLKSVDGGFNWTPIAGGLPDSVVQFHVDPANNASVYALVNAHGSAQAPLYRSADAGMTWTPAGWAGAAPWELASMAVEPGRSSTIYLAGANGLFKSTDSGAVWTKLTPVAGIPLAGMFDVAVDPQSPSVVYASAYSGLVRSADGGASWGDVFPANAASAFYQMHDIELLPGHNARLIGLRQGGGIHEADVAVRLELSRTPTTVTVGQPGTIAVTVRNNSPLAATRVRVTSALPAASGSYAVQATGATCAIAVSDLTCDIGTLPAAASAVMSVSFTPAAAGAITFSMSSYESLAPGATPTTTVNVASAGSSGSSGGGGGGGGRLDYLLLALLGALQIRAAVRRR